MKVLELNHLKKKEDNKHCFICFYEQYIQDIKKYYLKNENLAIPFLISEVNWLERHQKIVNEELYKLIRPGDICYIDYGKSYMYECGYQHFGLIISICNNKILTIPLTSSEKALREAYDQEKNPLGKKHLMVIDKQKGLNKKSVLYLNDTKYLNSARIISINGHIDIGSSLFKVIIKRLMQCMFQ